MVQRGNTLLQINALQSGTLCNLYRKMHSTAYAITAQCAAFIKQRSKTSGLLLNSTCTKMAAAFATTQP